MFASLPGKLSFANDLLKKIVKMKQSLPCKVLIFLMEYYNAASLKEKLKSLLNFFLNKRVLG